MCYSKTYVWTKADIVSRMTDEEGRLKSEYSKEIFKVDWNVSAEYKNPEDVWIMLIRG